MISVSHEPKTQQGHGVAEEDTTGFDRFLVVGSVVALLLLLFAAVLGFDLGGDERDPEQPVAGLSVMFDDERAETAVSTASEQVEGLLTLNPATVDRQLKTLTARTTGDFRRQFEALVETFASVVRQGKVSTRGEINGAGLATLQDDAASVLVASSAAVTNTQTAAPTPRSYRMRVDLQWVDETWLVSGIEFVGGEGQEP